MEVVRELLTSPSRRYVGESTLAVEFDDGDVRIIRRTTTQPVRSIKGQRPRTATSIS